MLPGSQAEMTAMSLMQRSQLQRQPTNEIK
jgi:hypothetical protein